METTKHTPTPWYVTASDQDGYVCTRNGSIIIRYGADYDMQDRDWVNARYIVRACNAYDDLVAACKTMADFCRVDDGDVQAVTYNRADLWRLSQMLKAAIAKTEAH